MINCHGHTDASNIRLLDCINPVEDLLKTAVQVGYKGIAITDHEALCNHVKALKVTKELKQKGEMPEDFKLILGNEIYLVDSLEEVRDNYQGGGKTKFPHFVLLSKNKTGYRQLRKLSSIAWENSFWTGTMERVPTEKHVLEQVVKESPNNLIASTACLGSEFAHHILRMRKGEITNDEELIRFSKLKINEFLLWCIDVFGKENFFIEIQPALSDEQKYYNEKAIMIAKAYDLKWIVTTDFHFLRPEDLPIHEAYLRSKDGERETLDFYEACFCQTVDEIRERLDYLNKEDVELAINNTMLIGNMVEDYDLKQPVQIPRINLPEFELKHLFKPAYDKFSYIKQFAYSKEEQDQYLLKLIEDGFNEKIRPKVISREYFYSVMSRINEELGELWEISQSMNQAMSSYYVTVREIINIIWDDDGGNSLVGIARGSAAGFIINYFLGVTQFNPMDYNLPHWRHLHRSRPDYPDIDIDTEGMKRQQILKALKRYFGEHRVLNICTFGTEGSKSALLTACRGMGIDNDIAMSLTGLIPFERGANWSLKDCLYGNEEKQRKPVKEFINEIEKYEGLKEIALKIEGLINKRSIHAGGIIIFNGHYVEQNAMMKAPNGQPITQLSMQDSEYCGAIKYDLLTIEALDKIRTTLDYLLEYNEIEWQGTLRDTYNKYFHPDVLEYDNQEMWSKLGKGEVIDLFQFNTQIGIQTAKKVKPNNLLETAVANSLMRLMSDGEEQPVDTYVKYKNNIELWYEELKNYGLNQDEIKVVEKHLKNIYGVADTQEVVMLMTMDEKISGFDVESANKMRKAIAKKSEKALKEVQKMFFEIGRSRGTSESLLSYVWNVQIKRQLGYSFSLLHTLSYSLIALQQLNIVHRYNPLYWNTACLTVNAASVEEEEDNEEVDDEEKKKNRSTNYGKIASAIGDMKQHGVKIALPDINKAGFGFIPDILNDQIIFGLKGINGIGDDVVQTIIQNRPYKSFNDFVERMYDTSLVKKSQVIQLIKAGCFDSFGNRQEIMKLFINKIYEPKTKLTMSNLAMIIENDILPPEYHIYKRYFRFRKHVLKNVFKNIQKPKDKLLILDDISMQFFDNHFSDDCIVEVHNGQYVISDKKFKKEYDEKMETIKTWITKTEVLQQLNEKLFEAEWIKHAEGNLSKWEMESLCFYYHEHELQNIDKEKYGIVNFNEQPEEPVVVGTYKSRGQERPKYEISRIAGTVLDKDKNKHTVTLLTTDGVVTVKFYDGAFVHYNKQISRVKEDGKKEVLEGSWFTRGNKLLIAGYRRGSQFKPYKYKDSIYQHTVALITDVHENGDLSLTTERMHI